MRWVRMLEAPVKWLLAHRDEFAAPETRRQAPRDIVGGEELPWVSSPAAL